MCALTTFLSQEFYSWLSCPKKIATSLTPVPRSGPYQYQEVSVKCLKMRRACGAFLLMRLSLLRHIQSTQAGEYCTSHEPPPAAKILGALSEGVSWSKKFYSWIFPAVPLKWRPVGEKKEISPSIKMEIMMQTTKNQSTSRNHIFGIQTISVVAGNFFSFTVFGSRIECQKVLQLDFWSCPTLTRAWSEKNG